MNIINQYLISFLKRHSCIILLFVALQCPSGCKKFVNVQPPISQITGESAFENDATAIAVLTGIYTTISNTDVSEPMSNYTSLSFCAGLGADELALWDGAFSSGYLNNEAQFYFYTNSLFSNPQGQFGDAFWSPFYNIIYTCNSVIEGLNSVVGTSSAVRQQLLGEAKFMRAFSYFYLTNFYGNVPLVLSSDFHSTLALPNSTKNQIYIQIDSDLIDAQNLLSQNYLDGTLLKTTVDRVRPTKWAATALLARSYLYQEDWKNAEIQATAIINNPSLFDTVSLNDVFLANSPEAIWQIQPVIAGWNTQDARLFIVPNIGLNPLNPIYVSSRLLQSFEPGDQRRSNWIDSVIVGADTIYFPYKYKSATQDDPVTEYLMVFRLAEQYLIRAEARAEQNNILGGNGALNDLNIIRARASLPPSTALTQNDIVSAILHERQVELFTESGQRWLDLKRTNQIDSVMKIVTPQKANGMPWNSFQQLYPFPYTDVLSDPNLKQNPGY